MRGYRLRINESVRQLFPHIVHELDEILQVRPMYILVMTQYDSLRGMTVVLHLAVSLYANIKDCTACQDLNQSIGFREK